MGCARYNHGTASPSGTSDGDRIEFSRRVKSDQANFRHAGTRDSELL